MDLPMTRRLLAALLLLCFTSACAQQAVFLSDPPGAAVFVDGRQIGTTPCTYRYQNGTGGDVQVEMAKQGYEQVDFAVHADEVDGSARNRWLAAGVVWSPLWLGTFFTKKLKSSYEFVLKKAPAAMTAQAPGSEPRF